MIMDFVNFDLAVKLKEKGFRKPCILYYNSDKVRTWFNEPDIAKNFIPTTLGNDDVLAPTISQVLKWLREKKKIHIELWVSGKQPIKWHHTIHTLNNQGERKGWSSGEIRNNYEQAALAGIEYVLDNLI